jgi:hypothetical protein
MRRRGTEFEQITLAAIVVQTSMARLVVACARIRVTRIAQRQRKSVPDCRALSRRPENAQAKTVRGKVERLSERVAAANKVWQRIARREDRPIDGDDGASDWELQRN